MIAQGTFFGGGGGRKKRSARVRNGDFLVSQAKFKTQQNIHTRIALLVFFILCILSGLEFIPFLWSLWI